MNFDTVTVFVHHPTHSDSQEEQLSSLQSRLSQVLRRKKSEAQKVYVCGAKMFLPSKKGDEKVPTLVSSLCDKSIIQIQAGGSFAIALSSTGDVYSAGSNGHGQLGRDENIAQDKTFRVIEALRGKHIIKISANCGCVHALALSSHGHVYTWGANFKSYSLGLQNPQDPEYSLAPTKICTPTEITSLRNKGIVDIFASGYSSDQSSFGITRNGDVYVWGTDCYQQVVPSYAKPAPALYTQLTNIKSIGSGGYHGVALTKDNRVIVFGFNTDGRLGLGNKTQFQEPKQAFIPGDSSPVESIYVGGCYTFLRTQEGDFYGFGDSANGALANGERDDKISPTKATILKEKGIVRLISGYRHCYGLTRDNRVYAWGKGSSGQLGNGLYKDEMQPYELNIDGVIDVAAGEEVGFFMCH